MNFVLHPWQLLQVGLAGWVNRQQQAVIEYLRTENQVLNETYDGKRIKFNDDQRRSATTATRQRRRATHQSAR